MLPQVQWLELPANYAERGASSPLMTQHCAAASGEI